MADITLPYEQKTVQVVDKKGSPIPYVNVIWGNTGTVTNESGYATLKVTSELQRVKFSFVGLKTISVPFQNIPDQVVMEEGLEQLDPVIVTSKGKTSWTTYASLGIAAIGLILTLKTGKDGIDLKKGAKPTKPKQITI